MTAMPTALTVIIQDRPESSPVVKVELAYTTFGGVKLVIAADDLDNARAALE